MTYRNTAALVIALSFFGAIARGEELKLLIGDRSLYPAEGLYHCELMIPENMPIEHVTLKMIDREGKKAAEMVLAITRIPETERQVRFTLSHEYIKNSKLLIVRSDTDILTADAVIVTGEYPVRKREGGKFVEVRIE